MSTSENQITSDQEATQLSSEFYSSLGSRYEDAFGHDKGLLRFLSMTIKHLPDKAQIFDLGCGTGHPVAKTLAATGHRIHGIDISPEMVRLSRAAVPDGTFELADMREWTPPANLKPDAIFISLSLFALSREEIESLVKKCASWLRPGGCLCVGTIAAEDCQLEMRGAQYDADGRCARDIGFRFMGDMTRITLFSKSGWKALLSDNGLEIVDTMIELFVPPVEANSEEETHFFFVGKKS